MFDLKITANDFQAQKISTAEKEHVDKEIHNHHGFMELTRRCSKLSLYARCFRDVFLCVYMVYKTIVCCLYLFNLTIFERQSL